MAFVVPQMPLAVNIWRTRTAGGAYGAPDVVTVGNLSPGKRVFATLLLQTAGGNNNPLPVELLLPKGTDIRARWNNTLPDTCEVPAGSLRFYDVLWVDDVGKGFANEYRIALILFCNNNSLSAPFGNTVPLPLP
jgi:hypothetical protein